MNSKEVIVSISLGGENLRVGKLWFHIKSSKESASFEYDKVWLEHPEKFALEPALKLTEGTFHTNQGINLFSAIGDSAPDRWGRILMRRAETAMQVTKEFRLKKEEAQSIIKDIASAVKQWRTVASQFGLSKQECDKMSSAFIDAKI